MKKLLIPAMVFGSLWYQSCSKQNPADTGGDEPTPPRWIELSVVADSIPRLNQAGTLMFVVVATGDSGGLIKINGGRDTLNYLWLSLHPDSSIVTGDVQWEGKVKFLDTVKLVTTFVPLKTSFIYFDYSTGTVRQFDWKVDLWVEYGYYDSSNTLRVFHTLQGYSATYVNTETSEIYTKIYAVKNN
ncbi:MAG: hypothetical protein M1470_14930 [Bacteroidetes bacterium]|nr:hypothetical protein [Bacteroidota bacterium]MCL5737499.1 hypothetical protein [Bacteroidota bacterium]